MTFQEKLDQLKITIDRVLKGKDPDDRLPVYSKDYNDLLDLLKNIEIDTPVVNLAQQVINGDTTNATSGNAVYTALLELRNTIENELSTKQDIPQSSDVVNNEWDFSGDARQTIVADADKVVTITNLTDSVKILQVIHTAVQHTITIGSKVYTIAASSSKLTTITATVVNSNLYLSDAEVLNLLNTSQAAFPSQNRIGLWKMSSINASTGNVVSWNDADGGGTIKQFTRSASPGPIYSSTDGVSFTNGTNLYRDPEGLTLGNAFTMYSLVKKTGDGSIMGLFSGQYLLYMTNTSLGFHPQDFVMQQNFTGIPNMTDFKVVALVYEGGTTAARVFVDGVMVGSFSPQLTPNQPTKLYGVYGNGDPLVGYMKGFTFFSEAHSDLDIAINSPLFKALVES